MFGLFDVKRKKVRHAAALRRAGDAPAAIDVLTAVLVRDPDNVAAHAETARALRILGDPAGAEEHLRTALDHLLEYTLVVELASVIAEQERVAEAEQLLDAALFMADRNPRLDPGEALLVRAAIAAGEGRPEDARAALNAIVRKRAAPLTVRYAERMRADLE